VGTHSRRRDVDSVSWEGKGGGEVRKQIGRTWFELLWGAAGF